MNSPTESAICSWGCTRIPSKIDFKEENDKIRIVLNGKFIQEKNMQEPSNAFEGWAVAAHICSKRNIVLDIDQDSKFQYKEYVGNGHLCRFLYRALKFSKQYGMWFDLSPYLKSETDEFEKYLKSGKFVNNIGSNDAGNKGKITDENAVEEKLAENGVLQSVVKSVDIGKGDVHRQLAVGLFSEEVKRDNSVFTGGKSAIDLWTINDDEINIIELKTNNKMIGIITEIYFYSNYIYDLVTDDGLFQLSPIPNKKINLRGYEKIINSKLKRVNGIMLADDNNYHPWVCSDSLDVLNENGNPNLKYFIETYALNDVIS